MSSCAFATSMPTKHGPALIVVRLPSGPTLHDAGSGGPGNCWGSWRPGRDGPRSPPALQDPGFKRPATSHCVDGSLISGSESRYKGSWGRGGYRLALDRRGRLERGDDFPGEEVERGQVFLVEHLEHDAPEAELLPLLQLTHDLVGR